MPCEGRSNLSLHHDEATSGSDPTCNSPINLMITSEFKEALNIYHEIME